MTTLALDTRALDTRAYSKKLIEAGCTQAQAEGLTEFVKQKHAANKEEIKALKAWTEVCDEKVRQELTAKQDLIVEAERIRREIEQSKTNLLKWQTGIAVALGSAMLTGFGGLAYIMARGFHRAWF